MRARYGIAVLVLGCALGGSPAEAAKCTISTTSIAFGSYNVFTSAPMDSTATLVFTCTGAKNVSIAIGRGQSTTFLPRTLKKGAEDLHYNLFLDAARSTVWGDGTGGTGTYLAANPPNNADMTVTIYGRIPPSQDISAGSYGDTVTVTIDF